jgi:catechol 2,3-dioxygenase-like lactoylglutathione lyase family enzyme
MSIVGLDEVTLSAADVAHGQRFLRDFGLAEVESGAAGSTFHARDGTGIRLRAVGDASLPPPAAPGPNIHEALWGVSDKATLEKLGAELGRDRDVSMGADGVLRSTDMDGNRIAFRVTQRKPFSVDPVLVNVPGQPPQRKANAVVDFAQPVKPCTFSHMVLHTGDVKVAERFYVERLGFRTTDRFTNTGVFMRADGCTDHHNLFFIGRPGAPTRGLNHLAFHVRDVNEVMLGGASMTKKGHETAWGPGRHIFGSNYFWYFKSPFGGNLEFDADMDIVNDGWSPREAIAGPEAAAIYQATYQPPGIPHR